MRFGKRWQLFTVTPLSDFTSVFDANNQRLLMIGVIATVVQILIENAEAVEFGEPMMIVQ